MGLDIGPKAIEEFRKVITAIKNNIVEWSYGSF